jgi:hypothetical protein
MQFLPDAEVHDLFTDPGIQVLSKRTDTRILRKYSVTSRSAAGEPDVHKTLEKGGLFSREENRPGQRQGSSTYRVLVLKYQMKNGSTGTNRSRHRSDELEIQA